MPDMSNSVKKVIFFTVKEIEKKPVFEKVTPKLCEPLFNYIMSLGSQDGLVQWMNGLKTELSQKEQPINLCPTFIKSKLQERLKDYMVCVKDFEKEKRKDR